MEIIVKKYEHYNRALGKHIRSKKHYNDEMKRQGMVSYDVGREMADKAQRRAPYKVSRETRQMLESVRNHTKKNGKVKLSGREIAHIEKLGMNLKAPKERPLEGGWE